MRGTVALILLAACTTSPRPTPTPSPTPTLTPTLTPTPTPTLDPTPTPPPITEREVIGPFETTMMPGRTVWYALPRPLDTHRLVAHIHGQCGGPSYACGNWIDAGTERGFMVCPTGNEHCSSPIGPPMWDESFTLMDQDLELGIKVAQGKVDGGISRDDAILTGFSRGGWAAIDIVRRHPGRWPYLILVEADVTIGKAYLEASKVRAVAMVAGEWGTELPGEKKSVDDMKAAGYPAELFVMPKTSHLYSANIDDVMRQALAFVLAH